MSEALFLIFSSSLLLPKILFYHQLAQGISVTDVTFRVLVVYRFSYDCIKASRVEMVAYCCLSRFYSMIIQIPFCFKNEKAVGLNLKTRVFLLMIKIWQKRKGFTCRFADFKPSVVIYRCIFMWFCDGNCLYLFILNLALTVFV